MVEPLKEPEDSAIEPSEEDTVISPVRSPKRPKKSLSMRSIVAISIAIALVAVGAFWALSWLVTSDERDEAETRQALEASWVASDAQRAFGVDFEFTVSKGDSSLAFSHNGFVSAKDGCYEGSSEYMVLEDGSLAIKDLSGAWASDEACATQDPDELFWVSKLIYEGNGWTAYGPDGEELVSELIEENTLNPKAE